MGSALLMRQATRRQKLAETVALQAHALEGGRLQAAQQAELMPLHKWSQGALTD